MSHESKTVKKPASDSLARQLAGLFVQHSHLLPAHLDTQEAVAATKNLPAFIQLACWAWRSRAVLQLDTSEERWNEFYQSQYGIQTSDKLWVPNGFGTNRPNINMWQIYVSNSIDLRTVIGAIGLLSDVDFRAPGLIVCNKRKSFASSRAGYRIETPISIEAVEYPGVSPHESIGSNVWGITLLERLLLDQFIRWSGVDSPGDNRIFLDSATFTICSGTTFCYHDPKQLFYPIVTRSGADRAHRLNLIEVKQTLSSICSVRSVMPNSKVML